MAHWVIPLYIISGIVMAIGAYLTIRYRPYCTLKSPEREIAMELHRKKLKNEACSNNENRLFEGMMYETKYYSLGDFLIVISAFVHILIFAGNLWYLLSPIYYVSLLCIITIFVAKTYFLPFCFQKFPILLLSNMNKEHLVYLDAFWKKSHAKFLKKNELKILAEEESALHFFRYYTYIMNFGVVLHLLLDLWFGISGSLTIN